MLEYAKIAFADLSNIVDADGKTVKLRNINELPPELTGAIAEIKETSEGVQIKLHSKVKALDSLAKHLGLFERDNEQRKGNITIVLGQWAQINANGEHKNGHPHIGGGDISKKAIRGANDSDEA